VPGHLRNTVGTIVGTFDPECLDLNFDTKFIPLGQVNASNFQKMNCNLAFGIVVVIGLIISLQERENRYFPR
jgi:hypothetical protein